MRCPSCGARNSEDASWCTQCYDDLRGPTGRSERPGEPSGSSRTSQARDPSTSWRVPAEIGEERPRPRRSHARDIREVDGVVEWRCHACHGWSPLEVPNCTTCGTPRRGFGDRSEQRPAVEDTNVVAASVLFPGLGHLLVGRTGSGAARALLALLWLVGGLTIVVGDPTRGGLPGWVLLLGAGVLWVATVIDAQRLTGGDESQLLGTRGLSWLVLGVTVTLVAAAGLALFSR